VVGDHAACLPSYYAWNLSARLDRGGLFCLTLPLQIQKKGEKHAAILVRSAQVASHAVVALDTHPGHRGAIPYLLNVPIPPTAL
jgi:hypothetical protein